MHELLFAIALLYFCNKLIRPNIPQSMARMIRLWRSIYFLYRRLEVVTMYVCVIVEVACTWRYTRAYAKTRMSLHMHGFACVP